MKLENLSQMTDADVAAALPGNTAALNQMVREYGEHAENPVAGVVCSQGGMCWSHPGLKLHGFRTKRQLLNAMAKKRAKIAADRAASIARARA